MEFLMDKRVIDYPYVFRKVLVGGIIVPFRAAKSAGAYSTIWTKEGSPLIVLTRQLQQALGGQIEVPSKWPCAMATQPWKQLTTRSCAGCRMWKK